MKTVQICEECGENFYGFGEFCNVCKIYFNALALPKINSRKPRKVVKFVGEDEGKQKPKDRKRLKRTEKYAIELS